MKLGHRTVCLICAILVADLSTAAAQSGDTLSVKLFFRQNISAYDSNYRGNGARLNAFIAELNDYLGNPANRMANLYLRGSASPEGYTERNEELGRMRSTVLTNMITSRTSIRRSQILVEPTGADWNGLVAALNEYDFYWVNEAVDIVRNVPVWSGPDIPSRLYLLKTLYDGIPWRWMMTEIFPELRMSEFSIVFTHPKRSEMPSIQPLPAVASAPSPAVAPAPAPAPAPVAPAPAPAPDPIHDTLTVSRTDTLYIKEVHHHHYYHDTVIVAPVYRDAPEHESGSMEAAPRRPVPHLDTLLREPVFAFRTNLLLPAMNLGVEVPIGNRWSVAVDWYYPWAWRLWMNAEFPAQKNCFQMLGGYAEARYWLGKTHRPGDDNRKYRLGGHSIALVGAAGYYDFGREWTGHQGEIGAIGLDYLYSRILGKGGAHLDFDLALGYAFTQYRDYVVYEEGGKLFGDGTQYRLGRFIPIKAGVSLVVPIFRQIRKEDAE